MPQIRIEMLDTVTPCRSEDITGKKFSHMTVLRYAGRYVPPTGMTCCYWWCKCDCGNEREFLVKTAHINQGVPKSCGCSHKRGRRVRHGHGGRNQNDPIYSSWCGMVRRCVTKSTGNYERYGGRGITVCDRWRLFENFLADMGPTHQVGLQLDRIDNSKGYFPENCRWATRIQQACNRRSSRFLEAFGRKQTVTEWAREVGINKTTLFFRLNNGWSPEEALSKGTNRGAVLSPPTTQSATTYVVPAPRPA